MNRRGFFTGFASDKPPDEPHLPHVGSPGTAIFTNALLRTHENKQVRFYDDLIRGKQVMINLMYASCEGFCPTITGKLAQVHEALKNRMGKDLFMYSITIKPEDDDPAALMHFAQMHEALLPGWTFLTGDPYDIETIRYRLFSMDHIAIDLDPNSHTSSLRIINDSTNRWVEVNPMVGLNHILKVISWADPPKTFKQKIEENKALQEKIDNDRKMYGYRRTI
jgi:protein SCO1